MSEVHIKIENNHHRYYTELPNIIFEIGLTPIQISTYAVIKRAAGEHGQCTRSYSSLCKMIGIKETCLKRTLKELSEKNTYISKKLINIRNRLTEHGDRDTNEIIIVDIWIDNYNHFKKQIGESPKDSPGSSKDPGVGRQKTQGGSPKDYKEEPIKNNPIKNNQPPANSTKKMAGGDFEFFKLIEFCVEKEIPIDEEFINQLLNEGLSIPAITKSLREYYKKMKNNDLKGLERPRGFIRTKAREYNDKN